MLETFKTIVLSSFLLFSEAKAQPALDLNYYPKPKLTREEKACLEVGFGCTQEEMLSLLERKGKALSPSELESIIKKDPEKKFFIPLSLDNQELITLAIATSLGVVAFKNDQEIMDVVQRNKTPISDKLATVGDFFGSGVNTGVVAAGSYFVGMIFKDNKLKQVGLFTIGASMATSMVTSAAKVYFGRVRPREDVGPYRFFESGKLSFPSGHTTEAFTIATVISELYKEDYPVVPYVAYGLAAITAYARMHDKAHWASDVIIGGVVGHLVTKLALSAFNGNEENRSGMMVYPSFDSNTGSFMLMFEWKEKMPESPMKCHRIKDENARTNACIKEAFEKAGKKGILF